MYSLESSPMYIPSSTLRNVQPELELPPDTQEISLTLTDESMVSVSSSFTVTEMPAR